MLPIRCIHPPCMNMDVITVCQELPSPLSVQTESGVSGKLVPAGAVCRRSAGTSPSWQTDEDSAGSVPKPWTSAQTRALTAIRPYVAYGVVKWGLSSRIGNTRPL